MVRTPRTIRWDDLTGAMDVRRAFAGIGGSKPGGGSGADACESGDDRPGARGFGQYTTASICRRLHAAIRVREIVASPRVPGLSTSSSRKIDFHAARNVVAETLRIAGDQRTARAVIAPAFPAQGAHGGKGPWSMSGVPLAETVLPSDALSPPPLAPLQQVLPKPGRAGVAIAGAAMISAASRISASGIVDGATDADLAATVSACRPARRTAAGGFGGNHKPLARACFGTAVSRRSGEELTGTIVFAVGSRAVQSAERSNP